MTAGGLAHAVAEHVELRQVPIELARVLADPEVDDLGSRSWASGYPLAGTTVAAQKLVRQAEAAGDDFNGQWGMYEIILHETS